MEQQCVTPTVHCTYGTEMYGTNSALYRWRSNVWLHQCTVQMEQQCIAPTVPLHPAQHCMAPRAHRTVGTAMYGTNSLPTYGTAIYGTNSAPYIWHSNVWHQQFTVQMAEQCMAPTVRRTNGTAMYSTNSAQCYGVTIRTAVFSCL